MPVRVHAVMTLMLVAITSIAIDATVFAPTEFREVVADATTIVRGRVTDVRGVAVPGNGIDTIATVAVESTVKGSVTDFISVHLAGGQVGRSKWVVVGAPTLALGDRVVLFLKRGTDNALRPIGLSMGVYRVQPDAKTGQWLVDPPAVPGQTAAATGAIVRGDVRRKPIPVQEFESLVRLVMAVQAQSKGGTR